MMKILTIIFRFFSFIYPYKLHCKLLSLKNSVYSFWIRNFIGYIGEHSRINYPCSLQGGGQKQISIGDYTSILGNSILGCWVKYCKQDFHNCYISIGSYCSIGEFNHISACNGIKIGDGLLTGRYVIISDNAHGELSEIESAIRPSQRDLKSKGEIVIGNNVWLADKVAVLSGVHIGNNVIVAANAVVTKDLPDNCIAAGVPAIVVKRLSN